jgi:hypothetical protein
VTSRRSAADGVAEQPFEHRTAALRVGTMAGVAREILEQLRAGRRERAFRRAAAQPRLILARIHHDTWPIIPEWRVPQYSAQNR